MILTVTYDYGLHKGEFTICSTSRGTFQWIALGNSGEEKTLNLAIASARQWIINSIRKGV